MRSRRKFLLSLLSLAAVPFAPKLKAKEPVFKSGVALMHHYCPPPTISRAEELDILYGSDSPYPESLAFTETISLAEFRRRYSNHYREVKLGDTVWAKDPVVFGRPIQRRIFIIDREV